MPVYRENDGLSLLVDPPEDLPYLVRVRARRILPGKLRVTDDDTAQTIFRSVGQHPLKPGKLRRTERILILRPLRRSPTWILYFNEDRFDALNTPYPYDDVRSGKWTLDKFYELCQSGASLNGQDSYKYDENSVTADYGIVTHNQCVQSMMFGTGETLISTKDGKPVFSGESDRVYGVFEKIAKIFGTDGVCLDRDKIGATDTDAKPFARTAFRTGHFMFMSETLGHIAGLRDFDGNFGVLPLPKYDENQESYHSMMATWGTLMTTIPASASDPERSGVILDALAFDSYKNLMEPYYETYLNQKGARNEDSAEMLKIIRETRVINVGHMFGWTGSVTSSITSLVEKGNASVASAIAKAKPSIEKNIDKTLTAMAE